MELKNDKQPRKIKTPEGNIMYVHEGKLHNWDGPALIKADGSEEYYLNGIKYSKDKWKEFNKNKSGLPYYKQSGFKARF